MSPFDGVARESEIPNADDATIPPIQENKVPGPCRDIVRIAHEYRRPPLNETRNEIPVVNEGVLVEVRADLPADARAKPVHYVEPAVVGKHVADRVEVACVEALDVGKQARALRLGQHRNTKMLRLPRQLAKVQASALQGGLDGGNAASHDICNLPYGVAEHVSQEDGTTRAHRKTHEGPQAGCRDLTIVHEVSWVGKHLQVRIGTSRIMATAAPRTVQRRVVRDSKEPASRIGDRWSLGQSLDRLQEGLVDHILGIDH
jgi:hypothetical protein